MRSLSYPHLVDLPMEDRTVPALLAALAKNRPDDVLLLFADEQYTFGEVQERVVTLASGLQTCGIGHGDHVAVLMDNSPDLLVALLALATLGAVALPVNTAMKGELLDYYLREFAAVALVVDSELLTRLDDDGVDVSALRLIAARGEVTGPWPADSRVLTLSDLAGAATAETLPMVAFHDPLMIAFTSGTSGASKGTIITHANVLSSAHAYVQAFGITEADTAYVCLPLFHLAGYTAGFLTALVAGARVALARRFSASGFWADVTRFGATRVNALGSMVNILWSQPPGPADACNPLKTCFAVPVPEFWREFENRFGTRFVSGYGSSDYCIAALLPACRPDEKAQTAGLVRPEIQVRIFDEHDRDVATGASGEICVRTKDPWLAAQGYYGRPDLTAGSYRNQWYHSGDLGHFDDDGYLHYDGRRTDSMRRRGENISAFELEQLLAVHPDVAEVAAFAVPSEMAEDEVMVTVVRAPGAELDERALIDYARTRMPYFMVPRYVEFRASLPRTPTHKIEKFRLREAALERLAAIWDREREGVHIGRD